MEIGMLWLDDSKTALDMRLKKAADYYEQKYKRRPNYCLLNPDGCDFDEAVMAGMRVKTEISVLSGHFWLGVEEDTSELDRDQRQAA